MTESYRSKDDRIPVYFSVLILSANLYTKLKKTFSSKAVRIKIFLQDGGVRDEPVHFHMKRTGQCLLVVLGTTLHCCASVTCADIDTWP